MSYSGLSIQQADSKIAMTVDLEAFYKQYETGTMYEDVLQSITDYVVTHISKAPEFDIGRLNSYEEMKSSLSIQMVGCAGNTDKLNEIPHQIVEDMAVVYRFQLRELAEGYTSILVTNSMMEYYGITQEQLHQDALEAASMNDPVSIKNLDEIMYEITGGFMGSLDDPSSPMFIATNESRFNGAAVMNYPNFMDQAAEKLDGNFYILPSSIHELIMVSDSFGIRAAELKAMVTDINSSEVSPEEKLTDNVYHYDAESRIFEQAEKFEQRAAQKKERASVLDTLGEKKQECQKQELKPKTQHKREEPAR